MDFQIRAGLPFTRRVRVRGGVTTWPEGQRNARGAAGTFDLTPYLTVTDDGTDVLIDWVMSGADTRQLQDSRFDIILGDNANDTKAIIALEGQITMERTLSQ